MLLCGIESHVCVNQTAEDLIATGVEVHVAQDAVTSRTAENRAARAAQDGALRRRRDERRDRLFELLRQAGTPEFKEVQALSNERAYVLLEDGMRLDGDAVARPAHAVGEVVFNTAMTGYQEAVTDPSYARPDHHLHLSADRELRRVAAGDGVRPRRTRAR